MDGHVIALKENVLGIGGINTKNTLSLCEGQFCEEAEDGFADKHNIKLED